MSEFLTAADLINLIDSDAVLIDVRSPGEHFSGSAPNSLCLPILDDTQRAQVGTCYKEQGRESAIKLGHELVSGPDKDSKITSWIQAIEAKGAKAIYCARGGLRSQISQRWVTEAGQGIPRIKGGYKIIRRFLIQQIEELSKSSNFIAVAGRTGVGKTEFIRDNFLRSSEITHIDLEKLANHRGSAFGGEITPQPRQAEFENRVATNLIKARHAKKIIVEDESALIGTCLIPEILFARIKDSPVIILEASLDERIFRTAKDYVEGRLNAIKEQEGVESPFAKLGEYLLGSLHRISKRLGPVRTNEIELLMRNALALHERDGDYLHHAEWIKRLLVEYYDPQYEFGLKRRTGRVIAKGYTKSLKELLN
jgi:tRNA 2-selenouridine synthase